jgi:PAS domain S-box-containing protein
MAKKPSYEELEERVKELERESLERKGAGEAGQEYEEKYQLLVESLLDAVYEFDLDGKFIYVNEAATHMFGYSRDEFLSGIRVEDIIVEEEKVTFRKAIDEVLKGKTVAGERTLIRKDGTTFIGEIHSGPIYKGKDVIGVRGILRDITERKEAQEVMLFQSRAITNAFNGIAITDMEGNLTCVNESYSKMHGYQPDELIGKNISIMVPDEYMGFFKNEIMPNLYKGNWSGETKGKKKDGTTFDIRISSSLIEDSNGNPVALLGICDDITERKQAEEALRESEEKYRMITETSIDGIYQIDNSGKFIFLNEAVAETGGYTREEMLGMHFSSFISETDLPKAMRLFEKLKSGETVQSELVCKHKLRHEFPIYFSAVPVIREDRIVGLTGIMRDITEQKRAEKTLREREAELETKTKSLEEVNTALRVLLRKRDEDRNELEEKVVSNVKELVVPFAEKVKQGLFDPKQVAYMNILESNLNDIISPFLHNLSARYVNLTPTEIRVAHLVKEGKTTKETAELMALSPRTIETHRKNLRKKLGIQKNKGNLRSHLLSLK